MCLAATRNLNAGCDEHVAPDVRPTDHAARADIAFCVDSRANLREGRAETDRRGLVAPCEHSRQKRASQILSDQTWEQREKLRRTFERAIRADDTGAHHKRRERWHDADEREADRKRA